MAGSRTIRQYTDDAGVLYAIRCDKSNGNAAIFGGAATPLLAVRTTDIPLLPRGLEPRYVLAYNQANPNQRRKFYVGSALAVVGVLAVGSRIVAEDYPGAANTPGANATWVVTYYSGERRALVPSASAPDTALTDGTLTQ